MTLSFSLTNQRTAFQQHLDEERNQRIIFSGAFGIGKTYFLKDYFAHHEAEYVAVKLSPVNYSVSANEDIFRLIKYDILFELLASHDLQLETETISREVAYGVALQDKLPTMLNGLLGIAPLLNKDSADVVSVWTSLSALVLPFIKKTEAARKDPNLLGRVVDFEREVSKLPMLEEDFISTFIEQSLNKLATTEAGAKAKVLVIDDLDRIDPEHIFRLFNVFSAHLDYNKSTSNKFGFDKVIFVCDIRNIRNIFHSRYGADTDFTGYIDKFYSLEIYYFDNSAEVKEMVSQFIQGIVPTTNFKAYFLENITSSNRNNSLLEILLIEMIHAGALTIRRLQAVHGLGFRHVEVDTGFRSAHESKKNIAFPAIITLEVLNWIVGGVEALDRALQKVLRYQRSQEYLGRSHRDQQYFVSALLPVLDYNGHRLKTHQLHETDTVPRYEFTNTSTGQKLTYRLFALGVWESTYAARIDLVDDEPFREQNLDLFNLIYQMFTLLQKKGVLR
ncbi:P-loop NTPase fold protein [Hymenobacter sp. DG01]|uniref:P-loop NTPase fold protein n=1 Tax=Hymenobacter sp. DG01 TaxID=2584940 RepID=UPI00111E0407|nr:P-loop NTPase fold protein [Hymenobacter sp. DG01]